MSDFDKEAEREKLREKFDKEEDNREATEQMSELLLKGATMTNAHCSECGDPIFRYDGQEFCPTCQKPIARDTQANGAEGADSDDETADSESADGDNIEMADPSNEARVQFGGDASAETAAEGDARDGQNAPDATDPSPQHTADSSPSPSPPEAADDRTAQQSSQPAPQPQSARAGGSQSINRQPESERQSVTDSQDPPVSARQPAPAEGGAGDVEADLDAASALLAETVHRFAERAAATENPREAREHLKAAREAAEALDATRF